MTKLIVYKQDGQLNIVTPAQGRDVKDLIGQVVPKGCECRIIDPDELPEDRYFRNAWELKGSDLRVSVNPEKAQSIHLETLRKMRNEELELSDVQLKIAEERGDEVRKQELINYRNELRDMTENLGSFRRLVDPKKIKAFMPDVLKRNMP